jgi:hypothetical protein
MINDQFEVRVSVVDHLEVTPGILFHSNKGLAPFNAFPIICQPSHFITTKLNFLSGDWNHDIPQTSALPAFLILIQSNHQKLKIQEKESF